MKRLNEKQWRDEKEHLDSVLLKAVDTVITESEEERVLNFRISTETPDSYNDVIKADGWDLERFEKNPVVLWAHSHREPPVGQALSVEVDGDALVASAKFADAETYAFADTVFRLLKKGFLRATSVGFFPKEWTYDEDRGGYNFIGQELFEFSIVPVPANPDALALAVADGIDCTPLKEWAEKTLDMWKPDDSVALWIPRAQIEELHKSLGGEPTAVTVANQFNGTDAVVVEETGIEKLKVKVEVKVDPILTVAEEESDAEKLEFNLIGELEEEGDPGDSDLGIIDDELEGLKAQVDQLTARLAAVEQAEKEEEVADESEGELSAVIDIQIDSHEVEDEVDLAILDLDINPEELQKVIRNQLENHLMKITGKLPKEV